MHDKDIGTDQDTDFEAPLNYCNDLAETKIVAVFPENYLQSIREFKANSDEM